MNQGKQANFTGRMLENQIISRIKESGYTEVKSDKSFININFFEDNIVTRHCYIGKSVYETNLFTDILLFNKEKFPNKLAIEIKWQQISGSVDEKYPYLVLNIKEKFPCPAIIILDGGGYKKGSKDWVKKQVDNKLIGVFSISEFLIWVNKNNI